MQIEPGRRLGPYEITGAIGAGGMGQVYSARDSRLDRQVAIKILPAEFAGNAQLRTRFEREAKAISQLNHPNICTIHDVGSDDGVDYLVMELLQGETLAERLARGPLPLDQVYRIGIDIADALDKAHRQGITHRDLKPGNVMITKSGAKLLDFGLARVSQPEPQSMHAGETEQMPLTAEGVVVGTYQYMAPEQLAGEGADHRSDIFALGAVLYEMATGHRAFEGKSRTSVVAAILAAQPRPVSEIQPLTPPALDHVISRALDKDPDSRWQSAHDIAQELRWIASSGSSVALPTVKLAARRNRERLAWTLAAFLLLSTALLAVMVARNRPEPGSPVRMSVVMPALTALHPYDLLGMALSPDGSTLVFSAWSEDGKRRLWIRRLASATAEPLADTADAHYPFWSPDGRQIAFFADGELRRIDLLGGSPRKICDAPSGRGGAWGRDGTILLAPNIRSGIYRVPAEGGEMKPVVAQSDSSTFRWPVFLPDNKHFVYVVRQPTSTTSGDLWVAAVDGSNSRLLLANVDNAAFSQSHLIFARGDSLFAHRFDPSKLEFAGEAFPVMSEKVSYFAPKNLAIFSAAENGTLAFLPLTAPLRQVYLFSATGEQRSSIGRAGIFGGARLSPDGNRIAAVLEDASRASSEIWIFELGSGREQRLTYSRGLYGFPLWSSDGTKLTYYCQTAGVPDICVQSADGGEAEVVIRSNHWKIPGGWLSDGSILYGEQRPTTNYDILAFSPHDGKTTTVAATPFEEFAPVVSHGGEWIAYLSTETGKEEMFVRAVGATGRRWQIPAALTENLYFWSSDGREIYFTSTEGYLTRVTMHPNGPSKPEPLFRLPKDTIPFGVSPDRSTFVAAAPSAGQLAHQFDVILDWPALARNRGERR